MSDFSGFFNDEAGAAAAEYALILALISVFIVVSLSSLGNGIANTFNAIDNSLPAA